MHVGKALSEIGLEELWTCLDYYAKLSGADGALGETPDWLWPAVTELKEQALLWLYGRRCDDAADALPDSADYTIGDLLQNRVEDGDVVVSFNYDTIVERLAARFDRDLRHCDGSPRGFVKFVKPHGSASWPLRPAPSAAIQGKPLLDSLAEDMRNNPLVLGAVPIKSELLREVQACHSTPDVFKAIMHQWEGVVEAIRDADELIVIGYSFPKEDQYGRFLFQEAIRRRGRKPIRIEYYNTIESGADILETFANASAGLELVWKDVVKGPIPGAK